MKINGPVPRKWPFNLRQSLLNTLDFTTLKVCRTQKGWLGFIPLIRKKGAYKIQSSTTNQPILNFLHGMLAKSRLAAYTKTTATPSSNFQPTSSNTIWYHITSCWLIDPALLNNLQIKQLWMSLLISASKISFKSYVNLIHVLYIIHLCRSSLKMIHNGSKQFKVI
jgi:hypothetical protein